MAEAPVQKARLGLQRFLRFREVELVPEGMRQRIEIAGVASNPEIQKLPSVRRRHAPKRADGSGDLFYKE